MSQIALGWLAALGAGLVAALAVEIAAPEPGPLGIGSVPAASVPGNVAAAPAIGAEGLRVSSILARPLFDRSRRPSSTGRPVAGVLRLTGVVVGPSGREAIFEPVAGGKPLVVSEGERVNGALVRVIAPGAVLMVDESGAHLISPAYESGAPAVATGPIMHRGVPK